MRPIMKGKAIVTVLITAILLLTQASCVIEKYRAPIEKFQKATALVTVSSRDAYQQINKFERARFIKNRSSLGKTILLNEVKASELLDGDGLNARLEALNRLNDYVNLLKQIVEGNSGKNIAKSATDLKTALDDLSATISPGASNQNFRNKFGVVTAILTEVLSFLAQKKQKEALDTAILKGEEPINDLIQVIGEELSVAFKNGQVNISKELPDIHKLYNLEAEKPSPNQARLDTLATKMIATYEAYDLYLAGNPNEPLMKMKEAHSKIVKHAKAQTPESFSEALEAVDVFVGSATRMAQAIVKLKEKNDESKGE